MINLGKSPSVISCRSATTAHIAVNVGSSTESTNGSPILTSILAARSDSHTIYTSHYIRNKNSFLCFVCMCLKIVSFSVSLRVSATITNL
jgi:hypothetical protein